MIFVLYGWRVKTLYVDILDTIDYVLFNPENPEKSRGHII